MAQILLPTWMLHVGGPNPGGTLILNFSLQNCERIQSFCFKAPNLKYFVMAPAGN